MKTLSCFVKGFETVIEADSYEHAANEVGKANGFPAVILVIASKSLEGVTTETHLMGVKYIRSEDCDGNVTYRNIGFERI